MSAFSIESLLNNANEGPCKNDQIEIQTQQYTIVRVTCTDYEDDRTESELRDEIESGR